MSVIGIDLGASNVVVSVVGKGGIDTVTNNVSGRKTASQVGFDVNQRCLGETAKTNLKRNFRKTVPYPTRLIGKDFEDCGLEWDFAGAAKYVAAEDGSVHVNLFFKGEEYDFSMEQIVAMLLTHVKEITEEFTTLPAADIVITVPGYWSDKRRRALLNACQITGLHVKRVVNDLTAFAINYLYLNRKNIDAEEVRKVLIVDSGISCSSAGVFEFQKNSFRTLGCAYDENLGGRDIDLALANFFNSRFMKKNGGANIRDDPKAWLRLLTGCEGVKKTLNLGGNMAGINEVCILEDFDLNEQITRDEYLELLTPLASRLQSIVQEALEKSATTSSELFAVEWVGGNLRVEALQLALAEVVQRNVENHMNAEEGASHGAALLCAYESPRIKLQNQFTIGEVQDNGIVVSWGTPGEDMQSLTLIKSNGRASFKPKQLTLKRPEGPMRITLNYENADTQDPIIASYLVQNVPRVHDADFQDVVVKFKYDSNFITNLTSIYVQNKVEVSYQEEVKPEGKTQDSTANSEGSQSQGDDVEMTDAEPKEFVTKTKTEVKKVPLDFIVETKVVTEDQIKEWQVIENKLREIDTYYNKCEFTKNSLESYVYTTRAALNEKLKEFTTEHERVTLLNDLNATESWLYDDGARQPLEVYQERLAGLKSRGDKYFLRFKEWDKEEAIAAFYNVINNCRAVATSGDDQYAHIENLGDILTECDRVAILMEEKFAASRALDKTDDPNLFIADIEDRTKNLGIYCQNILNKPKPKPKAAEKKAPEPENTTKEPTTEEVEENTTDEQTTTEAEMDVD